jgi:hypothetical protein
MFAVNPGRKIRKLLRDVDKKINKLDRYDSTHGISPLAVSINDEVGAVGYRPRISPKFMGKVYGMSTTIPSEYGDIEEVDDFPEPEHRGRKGRETGPLIRTVRGSMSPRAGKRITHEELRPIVESFAASKISSPTREPETETTESLAMDKEVARKLDRTTHLQDEIQELRAGLEVADAKYKKELTDAIAEKEDERYKLTEETSISRMKNEYVREMKKPHEDGPGYVMYDVETGRKKRVGTRIGEMRGNIDRLGAVGIPNLRGMRANQAFDVKVKGKPQIIYKPGSVDDDALEGIAEALIYPGKIAEIRQELREQREAARRAIKEAEEREAEETRARERKYKEAEEAEAREKWAKAEAKTKRKAEKRRGLDETSSLTLTGEPPSKEARDIEKAITLSLAGDTPPAHAPGPETAGDYLPAEITDEEFEETLAAEAKLGTAWPKEKKDTGPELGLFTIVSPPKPETEEEYLTNIIAAVQKTPEPANKLNMEIVNNGLYDDYTKYADAANDPKATDETKHAAKLKYYEYIVKAHKNNEIAPFMVYEVSADKKSRPTVQLPDIDSAIRAIRINDVRRLVHDEKTAMAKVIANGITGKALPAKFDIDDDGQAEGLYSLLVKDNPEQLPNVIAEMKNQRITFKPITKPDITAKMEKQGIYQTADTNFGVIDLRRPSNEAEHGIYGAKAEDVARIVEAYNKAKMKGARPAVSKLTAERTKSFTPENRSPSKT